MIRKLEEVGRERGETEMGTILRSFLPYVIITQLLKRNNAPY